MTAFAAPASPSPAKGPPVTPPAAAEVEIPLAAWTRELRQSALRELLSRPGLLSFALGMPAAELFPVRAYARAARHVLRTEPDALQYGLPVGRLRAHVVELMARRGVECTEAEVFLTSGAQHAMSLLGQLLGKTRAEAGGRAIRGMTPPVQTPGVATIAR